MKRLSILMCAIAALAVCSQALSADLPTTDGAGLQAIGKANQQTAQALEVGTCASERAAVNAGSANCKDSACVIALAAISALTPCAVMQTMNARIAAAAPAPAPQIINTAPPPSVGERIVGFFTRAAEKLFDVGVALGPSYLNMRSTNHVSDNNTRANIAAGAAALEATRSTNATYASLGANIQNTATAGFRSNVRIAADGFGAATSIAASGNQVAAAYASRATTQITTGAGSPVTIGTGNVVNTQNGTENRQTSPGPCTSTTGTQTPTTGSPAASSAAPCTVN